MCSKQIIPTECSVECLIWGSINKKKIRPSHHNGVSKLVVILLLMIKSKMLNDLQTARSVTISFSFCLLEIKVEHTVEMRNEEGWRNVFKAF